MSLAVMAMMFCLTRGRLNAKFGDLGAKSGLSQRRVHRKFVRKWLNHYEVIRLTNPVMLRRRERRNIRGEGKKNDSPLPRETVEPETQVGEQKCLEGARAERASVCAAAHDSAEIRATETWGTSVETVTVLPCCIHEAAQIV